MTSFSTEWKDDAKEFFTEFQVSDAEKLERSIGKRLPQYIAERSWCSCGSSLRLGDHNIVREGATLRFSGTFRCPQCNTKAKNVLRLVVSGLSKIKKFKFSDRGIEIEK